ncbi:MAG: Asp-tRNA(Asn)/Glu-tRNA(Gln) amidotransferase subunit GatC [Deltaproteobacteria bacterium]|nr:MAG: Asp-tRNA(Asn)/Glu-tRNA(Gln) amidotransferase subunit GatC [Deltaproteobacteria bacterium]
MALSLDEVRAVARLARLALSDEEAERMRGELAQILEWMARLDAVDTEGVLPLAHVHALACPLREDRVEGSLGAEAAVAGAPAREGTAFSVPRVLGET